MVQSVTPPRLVFPPRAVLPKLVVRQVQLRFGSYPSTKIPARGNADTGAAYAFTDNAVMSSVTYYYKLEYVDVNGVSTFHGPASAAPY